MKNELNSLVMMLVAVTIFLATTLLVVGCEDDHLTTIIVPPDSLTTCEMCATRVDTVFIEVLGDSLFCYRTKDNGYKYVCEAERRDDP